MRNSLSLLGLVPLLAGSTFGQTGTDDCLSPTVLNGTGSWTWDNAAATTSGFDGGDSVACFSPANPAFDDGPYRDLFWAWTANADGDYTFDTEGSTGNTDTKLNVHFGGDCSATCVGSDDDSGSTPNRSSSFDVTGVQSGDTYLLQVGSWTASSPSGAGLLNIDFERCSVLGDDGFEDNDDCDQAVTIGNGTQPGLTVSKTDWDYYRILVPNGGVLSVDLDFVHLDGDIDAYLYDPLVACATFADGDVGNLNSIDASASFDDDESLIWMNTTGLSRFVVVKVYVWPSTFSSDCNSYSMTVSGAFDPQAGLFCDPGQTHVGGGSVDLSSSCVCGPTAYHLEGTGGPEDEFGFFLVAATYSSPGISVGNGLLCLQLPIGRYNQNAGGVWNSLGAFDAQGTFQSITGNSSVGSGFDVPFQLPSTPGGFITPGDTWSFQMWFRDGLSSNLSNGITVQF
tara:strand:+ start:3155 stop:4516 length:1362 start_codon:yes stop_codon:yes gene_type:complete